MHCGLVIGTVGFPPIPQGATTASVKVSKTSACYGDHLLWVRDFAAFCFRSIA
jgi:hypothetical protein